MYLADCSSTTSRRSRRDDANIEAERLIALVDGVALQALFDPDSWPPDRQLRALEVGLGAATASGPRDARRRPARLGADDLVLSHFSLGRDHPIADRIESASAAGFAGIGLYVGQFRLCTSPA